MYCSKLLLAVIIAGIIVWGIDALSIFGDPPINIVIALHIMFYVSVALINVFQKNSSIISLIPVIILVIEAVLYFWFGVLFVYDYFIELYCILSVITDCIWYAYLVYKERSDTANRYFEYMGIYFAVLTLFLKDNNPFIIFSMVVRLVVPIYSKYLKS